MKNILIGGISVFALVVGGLGIYLSQENGKEIAALKAQVITAENNAKASNEKVAQLEQNLNNVIAQWIKDHPTEIISSLQDSQRKAQEEMAKVAQQNYLNNKDKVFDASAPFVGNPNGKVVIAEFVDFYCGYCRKSETEVLKDIKKDFPELKIIKHVLGRQGASSIEAAKLFYAAQKQEKAEQAYHALIEAPGNASKEVLIELLVKAGLDGNKLLQDYAYGAEQLQKAEQLAGLVGARGTPYFYGGDEIKMGAIPKEEMASWLKSLEAKSTQPAAQ